MVGPPGTGKEELERAKDKITMGAERRSMVMSEADKRLTAYHEAGHTIVGRLVPEQDPVHKVSIIPRGRALGVTQHKHMSDETARQIDEEVRAIVENIRRNKEGVSSGLAQVNDRIRDKPPSTASTCPVIQSDSSASRKHTADAMSAGLPIRCRGCRLEAASRLAG